ncbi:TrkH family potassium uptake protein [Aminipila butyrica]|uniref:TrkH family potassium uptake protein n=1 Tax=Aminipila butyrica TaxID=433296 RepID=A0A858BY02_9FIRM|nr:TrkH family potassium uptake protein [Aminipila butyrica]QIB69978.1 TrkH family potassium uptake protein [Aminipila butyrica]
MSFNYRVIFKFVSLIPLIMGLAMILPAGAGAFYGEWPECQVFSFLALFSLLLGSGLFYFFRPRSGSLHLRDGYLIVCLCGLIAFAFGAAPYLLTGQTASFIDSFFESVSTLTTTGSTVFHLDDLPRSLLLWRGICSWLGGISILVLCIAILPSFGMEGKSLAQAEVPGQILGRSISRTADSAKYLYILYIAFTAAEWLLLALGPMDIFDALINTMSSISTSSLGWTRHSFAQYDDLYTEAIVAVFTLLASVNFALYFLLIHRNWKAVLNNIELRAFFLIILLSSLLVSLNLYLTHSHNLVNSIRYGIFQVISMATTSGFSIASQENWPALSLGILSVLMLMGSCSFSTGSGIRVIRILVLCKLVARGFTRRIHPRSVVAVKIGPRSISALRVSYITVFVLLYFILIVFGSILLSLQNLDMLTTLSTSLSMISNVGIGFGEAASGNFSIYCAPLKLVLCFLMIVGRLELFTVITLFMPSFWSPDKYKNN